MHYKISFLLSLIMLAATLTSCIPQNSESEGDNDTASNATESICEDTIEPLPTVEDTAFVDETHETASDTDETAVTESGETETPVFEPVTDPAIPSEEEIMRLHDHAALIAERAVYQLPLM